MQQSLLVAKASRGAMAIEKSIASQRYSQVISRSSSSTQTPTISNPVLPTNGRSRLINASSEGSSLSAHSAEDSDSSPLKTDKNATPTGRPPIPPKPKPKPLANTVSNVRGLTRSAHPSDATSVSSYEQVAGAFEKTDSPFDSPPVSARMHVTALSDAYSDQGREAHQMDYFNSNPPPPPPRRKRPESIQITSPAWQHSVPTPSTSSNLYSPTPSHASDGPIINHTTNSQPSHSNRQLSVSGIAKTFNALQVGAEAAKESVVNANRSKGFGRLFRSEKEDNRRLVSSDEEEPADQNVYDLEEEDNVESWRRHRSSQSQIQLQGHGRARSPQKGYERNSMDNDSAKVSIGEDGGWRALR